MYLRGNPIEIVVRKGNQLRPEVGGTQKAQAGKPHSSGQQGDAAENGDTVPAMREQVGEPVSRLRKLFIPNGPDHEAQVENFGVH